MDAMKTRRKPKIKKLHEAKRKPTSNEALLDAMLDMFNALHETGQCFTNLQASSKQNSNLMKEMLERMKSA